MLAFLLFIVARQSSGDSSAGSRGDGALEEEKKSASLRRERGRSPALPLAQFAY